VTDADCVFCRVVAGELPSTEVAANDGAYAFRDRNPMAPVHVLIVPREHVESAATVRPEHARALADMLALSQEVAKTLEVDERGYRLVMNVGAESGMTVPHLHLHLLGGRRMSWPPG
jgi:histidine triad (HIT) family protein